MTTLKKIAKICVSVLLFYFLTLYFFGRNKVYDYALDSVTRDSTVDFSEYEFSIALKDGDRLVTQHNFDRKYAKLSFVNTEEKFTDSKNKSVIGLIIKSGHLKELGLVDIDIHTIDKGVPTSHEHKKYLWLFLGWIELE